MIERKMKTIKMSYEVASKNLLKLNNILILLLHYFYYVMQCLCPTCKGYKSNLYII